MIFVVQINGVDTQLKLQKDGETYRFRFGSQEEKLAVLEQVEPGVFLVLIGGRSYEARVEQTGACWTVSLDGRSIAVSVKDPRRWMKNSGGHHLEGRQNLTASMPGRVVRLLVAVGDLVAPGQGVIIVEAMKMQNEIKVPKAGYIVSIPVREGDTVNAGEILVTIE